MRATCKRDVPFTKAFDDCAGHRIRSVFPIYRWTSAHRDHLHDPHIPGRRSICGIGPHEHHSSKQQRLVHTILLTVEAQVEISAMAAVNSEHPDTPPLGAARRGPHVVN